MNLFTKKICACGCGKEFIPNTIHRRAYNRIRFIKGHHNTLKDQSGPKNHRWKGGRTINTQGYIMIKMRNHPYAVNGYVREHHLVWELHNNAILLSWADVHHINGVKTDNRIENLEAMTHRQHATISKIRVTL